MRYRLTFFALLFLVALAPPRLAGQVPSQKTTVFAAVTATRLFVVGAANPQTGVFVRQPGDDTLWGHKGAKTIRAFGVALAPGSKGRVVYIAAGNGVHL